MPSIDNYPSIPESDDFMPINTVHDDSSTYPNYLHHSTSSSKGDFRAYNYPRKRQREHLQRYGHIKKAGKYVKGDYATNLKQWQLPIPHSNGYPALRHYHDPISLTTPPRRRLWLDSKSTWEWIGYCCPCCWMPSSRTLEKKMDARWEIASFQRYTEPWEVGLPSEFEEEEWMRMLREWEMEVLEEVEAEERKRVKVKEVGRGEDTTIMQESREYDSYSDLPIYQNTHFFKQLLENAKRSREDDRREKEMLEALDRRWGGGGEDQGWGVLVDRALGRWEEGRRGWSGGLGWVEVDASSSEDAESMDEDGDESEDLDRDEGLEWDEESVVAASEASTDWEEL